MPTHRSHLLPFSSRPGHSRDPETRPWCAQALSDCWGAWGLSVLPSCWDTSPAVTLVPKAFSDPDQEENALGTRHSVDLLATRPGRAAQPPGGDDRRAPAVRSRRAMLKAQLVGRAGTTRRPGLEGPEVGVGPRPAPGRARAGLGLGPASSRALAHTRPPVHLPPGLSIFSRLELARGTGPRWDLSSLSQEGGRGFPLGPGAGAPAS